MLVSTFNFIDRQLLTVLAPYVKADLRITDAELGLLLGTTFALFYGLFGIPIARLADGWSRVRTISIGLIFWSLMTMVSGVAATFVQLATARIGVGIGEASASPAAASLLGDYFSKRTRSTVLAIFTSGIYIGIGLSLILGGTIVSRWNGIWGLKGWQAAFIIVGAPGILLGLLILFTVREPTRGILDGVEQSAVKRPFAGMLEDLTAMTPPFSILRLRSLGATRKVLTANLLWLGGTIAAVVITTLWTDQLLSPEHRPYIGTIGPLRVTGNLVQWTAIGFAVYATVSWVQAAKLYDPVAFALTVGTPTYRTAALSSGFLGAYQYGFISFVFLYGTRYLNLTADSALTLGVINAIGGGGGMALGGFVGDWAKRHHAGGRMFLLAAGLTLFTLATLIQYSTSSQTVFFVTALVATTSLTMWLPIMAATTQDLAIPRLRGTSYALTVLSTNLLGLGLGPYLVGFVSDVTGSLRTALLALLTTTPLAIAIFIGVGRRLPETEASVFDRARAAGEPI